MAKTTEKTKYHLNSSGEFVIENYNLSKPFANFFPGIAGKYGIPMWVFYVNRAQCVCSFGTKDKDHAIMEFQPANKAWQAVSSCGFRTFLKISSAKKDYFYEPFQATLNNSGFKISNAMYILPEGLRLEETNTTFGIKVTVEYFNIPNDNYAGLARIVSIKNLSRTPKKIQILDGIPQIVPFGTANFFLKKLGRTIEAWMRVENLENNAPFYKLAVQPHDRPEVVHIKEGNFYLGFYQDKNKTRIIKPITDPENIFGQVTDFAFPDKFKDNSRFMPPKNEKVTSKTPCAFLFADFQIAGNSEKNIYSVSGQMRSAATLNSAIKRIASAEYFRNKQKENQELIANLQKDIQTQSSSREFDLYAKNTYLDNILRGGYPVVFNSSEQKNVFYLYSRKHGDLERDYNKFQLQPAYFSQGNGSYRDMNQNRRSDLWFNPEIKETNLVDFFNLIQADGFNPLTIKGTVFLLKNEPELGNSLKDCLNDKQLGEIISFTKKPFSPGEVILFLEEHRIKPIISYDDFLGILIHNSTRIQDAEHGEGFWTDHWTYNLDLLESYLSIYPEKSEEIIFHKRAFTFYDNWEVVKPRSEKYVFYNGLPRQLHALKIDNAKKDLIKKRSEQPHVARSSFGQGEIYQTTLINKLLCLLANKLSSFDPSGCGIEMEAEKPNWYDALNGLPALFGSSLCETFELKRLILIIESILEKTTVKKVKVTEEIYDLLVGINSLINNYFIGTSDEKDYLYWDSSASLKEDYRQKIHFGFIGSEPEIDSPELLIIIENALRKVNLAIEKGLDKKINIYCSYFFHEVTEYETISEHSFKPKKFTQKRVPHFLEGQMHALRLSEDKKTAQQLYKATKNSELFDKKLKMYKVTASLNSMPEEIGRCRVFTPGWLENESIWLHMEYKYLLELLKQGLNEEFFEEFKNLLIPFQKPERYGRSILENSSFIVSSAFPDTKLHGNGFVARLSGSTAEFIEMWLLMNIGKKPFFVNESGNLNFKLSPCLPGWMFTKKEKTYTFNLFSNIKVIYYNKGRADTFGKNCAKINKITFRDKDNNPVEINSNTIPEPFAEQLRNRQINTIEVYFSSPALKTT
ncbi:MAG: cellobiose phosphorylase [Candidatus Omnitrophica bacterium]|nr:cellobiose phosphorylase [Candidatus Omnitrophota bacterium]